MISVWWTLVVFVGGGCAGVMLMALMRFSGDLPEHPEAFPRGWSGNDPSVVPRTEGAGRLDPSGQVSA
jgi:hypothetical protein